MNNPAEGAALPLHTPLSLSPLGTTRLRLFTHPPALKVFWGGYHQGVNPLWTTPADRDMLGAAHGYRASASTSTRCFAFLPVPSSIC